jgi:alpha-methylacyl-CoA racemase
MEGTDICFAPVLSFAEAPGHPHNQARGSFPDIEGVVQPGPAPRFSRTISAVQSAPPSMGAGTAEGLSAWGFSATEIEALLADKAIGWQE